MSKNTGKKGPVHFIAPDQSLKEKSGSGGVDPRAVEDAQRVIDTDTTDIGPVLQGFITILRNEIATARTGGAPDAETIEKLLYPIMQMSAHGKMFKLPAVTDTSTVMVDFLEVMTTIDNDVLDIISGYVTSMTTVLSDRKKFDNPQVSRALSIELSDACGRYFKSRKG